MRILLAIVLVCTGSVAFWAALDRPLDAPRWKGKLEGVSYNPSHLYSTDVPPSEMRRIIRSDIEHLASVTNRIRTYAVSDGRDRVPYIAHEFGMKVTLGLWL